MNWQGQRALVTGGAGVVGSYLVEQLVQEGAVVTVADKRRYDDANWPSPYADEVQSIECDLMVEEAARQVCRGQDAVFHLAARVAGIQYNLANNSEMLRINVTLTGNVLEAATAAGVPRCLVVSSACVYPQDAVVPTPESEGERGTPEPDNEGYGWAKRMGERLAAYYMRERGIEVSVVRPFNVFSPRDHLGGAGGHVIPAILGRLLGGEDPLTVWGSGRQTRSFLHAADLATAMRLVLELPADVGPVNIGSDREVSMAELVSLLCAVTELTPEIRFDMSKPEGHPRRLPDISKLRTLTSWAPEIDLQDGLAECAAAYRSWQSQTDSNVVL